MDNVGYPALDTIAEAYHFPVMPQFGVVFQRMLTPQFSRLYQLSILPPGLAFGVNYQHITRKFKQSALAQQFSGTIAFDGSFQGQYQRQISPSLSYSATLMSSLIPHASMFQNSLSYSTPNTVTNARTVNFHTVSVDYLKEIPVPESITKTKSPVFFAFGGSLDVHNPNADHHLPEAMIPSEEKHAFDNPQTHRVNGSLGARLVMVNDSGNVMALVSKVKSLNHVVYGSIARGLMSEEFMFNYGITGEYSFKKRTAKGTLGVSYTNAIGQIVTRVSSEKHTPFSLACELQTMLFRVPVSFAVQWSPKHGFLLGLALQCAENNFDQ